MLVDDIGPLNSFYSKIVIGYALGIYEMISVATYTIVCNIRNAFAHSKKLIQFDHPAVVNELRKAGYQIGTPQEILEFQTIAPPYLCP